MANSELETASGKRQLQQATKLDITTRATRVSLSDHSALNKQRSYFYVYTKNLNKCMYKKNK